MFHRRLILIFLAALFKFCVSEDTVDYGEYEDNSSYNKLSVCSYSPIVMSYVNVVCDSRGIYYYGGPNYRNSKTCKVGDKARLNMGFIIVEDLEDTDVYISVLASGNNQKKSLYNQAPLCNLGTLRPKSNSCPSSGSYTISLQFNWTISLYHDDGTSLGVLPYISVGFASDNSYNYYDLGGANTTKCSGDTAVTWTKDGEEGLEGQGAVSGGLASFLVSFGILLGVVGFVGVAAFFLWRRSYNSRKIINMNDEEALQDDQKKWELIGKQDALYEA